MPRSISFRRRGTTIVEVAMTAPVAFLLVIGLMIGGLGTFRYQQVAALAREGANYASIHGPYYQLRTGQPMATSQDLLTNAILPLAAGLDASALHCTLSYDTSANTATVQLTYDWMPEAFLPATTLSSTSVMPIEQ
jgi:Flp pilus assembly protein TadG